MPRGVMSGCLDVQASLCTFFPTHMARAIMFFNTLHLGFPQVELHRSLATIVGHGHAGSSRNVVPGFRCRLCGLLVREAASMIKHFQAAHPRGHSCSPHPDLYEPQQVWRLAHCFGGAAAPSNAHASCPRQCAFASLVYSQPGAKPVSLEVVAAYGAFFLGLLSYVHFSDTRPGQRKARQPDQRVHKPWAPRLVCMCFGSAAVGCAEAVHEVVVGLPSGSAHRYLSGAAALGTTGLFSRRPQWGGPGSSAGTSHSHDSRSSLAELARGRARLDALNVQPTVSLFSSSLPNSMTSMCCKVMEIMSLPWSGTAQLLPSGFLSSSALT